MEEFDGDELITIPYSKYQLMLKCKKRVHNYGFLIRLLEIDDSILAEKLSNCHVYKTTVIALEKVGIVTAEDLVYYIVSNRPKKRDDILKSLSKISGIGKEGAITLHVRLANGFTR